MLDEDDLAAGQTGGERTPEELRRFPTGSRRRPPTKALAARGLVRMLWTAES